MIIMHHSLFWMMKLSIKNAANKVNIMKNQNQYKKGQVSTISIQQRKIKMDIKKTKSV